MTHFICLDFDGLEFGTRNLDWVLDAIGLGETDYVLQYSSSQEVKEGFYAHVFMMLDRPAAPEMLKRWLKRVNLSVPFMADQLKLTPSKMALHWTLDITTCQNDKLLYIAPPVFNNMEDPFEEGGRIQLCKRGKPTAFIPQVHEDVDNQGREKLSALRIAAGCDAKDYKVRVDTKTGYEVLENPDKMSITGMREARGWTYLNINGSTSWGYYHKTANPDIIGNFRGEPYYRTKDVDPAYYREALDRAKAAKGEAHKPQDEAREHRWVINSREDGRYYKVVYRPEDGVTLYPAPTLKHLQDFCTASNIPYPEAIPDWDVKFDPTDTKPFDSEERWINIYQPTEYKLSVMRRLFGENRAQALKNPNTGKIPDMYYRLIYHFCGSDHDAAKRFINWLAYIWQTGRKAKTAWVMHGTYGTGKGRFLKILQALLGKHCVLTSPEQVNEKFNGNMAAALILWIDEVTTDSWDNDKVTPKLRQWIDGDEVPLRAMRADWVTGVKNFMSIIVAANEHNPVEIRMHDRRWNVAPRQEVKLRKVDWATPEVLDDEGPLYAPENLQALADNLWLYRVDVGQVREPLENSAKNAVMNVTQNLPTDIVLALEQGNVSFFLDYVSDTTPTSTITPADASEYKRIVGQMMEGQRIALRITDIAHIFKAVAGWNQSPGKFVKAVSKYGLDLSKKRCRIDGNVLPGTYFTFHPTEEDRAIWAQTQKSKLRAVKDA
jgi:hypothetical protein